MVLPHTPKPVCEHKDITANWPDIIFKNKKRQNMDPDMCGNTCG